jgi:hypothetical protein
MDDMPDALRALLLAGRRHAVVAANADEAFLRIQGIAAVPLDPAAFHAAVAEAVSAGLIREPIVLPEGALACHWRLSLTPAGLVRARDLIGS